MSMYYKTILLSLFVVFDGVVAFTNMGKYANRITNISTILERRDLSKIFRPSLSQLSSKPASISIASGDESNYTNNNSVSTKTRARISDILDNIMANCKKNGKDAPEVSIRNLQNYCSTANIVKNKNTKALTFYFMHCKYALLLGKYSSYEIIEFVKNIEHNDINYVVDMKVSAEYKTMLKNRIQFNQMYYPKNRDYNNICYVIFQWRFKKYEDGNLYIEGCNLIPPITLI
uniref:Uncharacterized protein n=1 Tax=viral metagenome TaxID=1070528 RepID=A0A6C0LI87_9ZZZZ